jgi:hypothetical protein
MILCPGPGVVNCGSALGAPSASAIPKLAGEAGIVNARIGEAEGCSKANDVDGVVV